MENLQAVPFIGIVEDINDEKKLGRVRVRVINHHDDNIPTEDLDWATVVHPTTSSAIEGAGMSPTWLEVGSRVFGLYIDGESRNVPIIIGTLGAIPNNDDKLHSVNRLARGEQPESQEPVGPEPTNNTPSQYPFNKTITTPGGHTIELDDTEGNQRVHIRHNSGAYVLINNDGKVIIRSEDDRFDVAKGNTTSFTKKDAKHEAKGKFEIEVAGDFTVKSDKQCTIQSTGMVNIRGSKVNING